MAARSRAGRRAGCRPGQLLVELLVLRQETRVVAPDVERDERRELLSGLRVAAPRWCTSLARSPRRSRGRAPASPSGWSGGSTRSTTRPTENWSRCVQREMHRAVAAGGDADERAAVRDANRAVDARRRSRGELARDRRLPVVAGPVEVLRIGVAVGRALRRDEDRRAARPSSACSTKADAAVVRSAGGQAVQEVDDGIARAASCRSPRADRRRSGGCRRAPATGTAVSCDRGEGGPAWRRRRRGRRRASDSEPAVSRLTRIRSRFR